MKAIVEPLAPLLGCGWDPSRTRGHPAPLQVPLFPPTVHAHLRAFVLLPAASQSKQGVNVQKFLLSHGPLLCQVPLKIISCFWPFKCIHTVHLSAIRMKTHTRGQVRGLFFCFFQSKALGLYQLGFGLLSQNWSILTWNFWDQNLSFLFLFVCFFLHSLSSICERGSGSYSGGCERRDCTAAV